MNTVTKKRLRERKKFNPKAFNLKQIIAKRAKNR